MKRESFEIFYKTIDYINFHTASLGVKRFISLGPTPVILGITKKPSNTCGTLQH